VTTKPKNLFSWTYAGILVGFKLGLIAIVVGLSRAGLDPSGFRLGANPLQEPNPPPSAKSVPRACSTSLGADPAASASALGIRQSGVYCRHDVCRCIGLEPRVALQMHLNAVPHCLADVGDWHIGSMHPLGVAVPK